MRPARRALAWSAAVVTLGVVAVMALVALVSPSPEAVATEVRFTPKQESRYLAEMKENLDGHPAHPRSGLVGSEVLVRQGVSACEWLATQPAGDQARREPAVRTRFFAERPRVTGKWPFKQGRSGIREEILTNSWGWLCADITEDHIDNSPVPED
jgi:hypothetical protein